MSSWLRFVSQHPRREIVGGCAMESCKEEHDILHIDTPLFIRLLEWAREDAKSDMELHKLTEKALLRKGILRMNDYNGLLP